MYKNTPHLLMLQASLLATNDTRTNNNVFCFKCDNIVSLVGMAKKAGVKQMNGKKVSQMKHQSESNKRHRKNLWVIKWNEFLGRQSWSNFCSCCLWPSLTFALFALFSRSMLRRSNAKWCQRINIHLKVQKTQKKMCVNRYKWNREQKKNSFSGMNSIDVFIL